MAANPSNIAAIAPRLWDSMPTITTTASTIVSMIGLASGTPFAANGAPRKIRPASVLKPREGAHARALVSTPFCCGR